MKKIKKYIGILLFILTFGLATTVTIPQIGNCIEVQAATISLNRKSASIYIGKSTQLKVNNYTRKIKWSSSNTQVATVSSTGKVTGRRSGSVIISATAGKKTLKCKVNVKSVINVSPKEIYLDGTDDATVKITLKHRCGLRYSIASPYVVSCSWDKQWYENNTVAYLYITGERTGTTYVTITNTFNNEKVRIKVTVDTTVKVEGVNISSSSESLYVGDSVKLSAEVYPSNSTDREITWYSEDENIATVSEYGRVDGVAAGQTRIIAKSSDGGYTASCIVTVNYPINVKLPQTPITIRNYGFNGGVRKSCIITNVKTESRKMGNSYFLKIKVDGEKTYDQSGANVSGFCSIGYKLYRNGAVVKSGTIYTTQISVGERFVDCYQEIVVDAGDYELQLLDVQ